MVIGMLFGGLLWSLDSRLAENNRDRASAEQADSATEPELAAPQPTRVNEKALKQSSADTAL